MSNIIIETTKLAVAISVAIEFIKKMRQASLSQT